MPTSADYATVTEVPGCGATAEQLSMLYTRYYLAAELADGKDVLEVACGPGIGLSYLARRARQIVGGDIDPKLVELAKRACGGRATVVCLDAANLPFSDGSFDVVLLMEAIYYLPSPERFLAEARRVLRPGGVLFISSVNREWPGFNPSPFSHRYFSAAELAELLCEMGFSVEISVGFPTAHSGARQKLIDVARRIAVRLHLIPKTMSGKAWLKRLFYGRLLPLPTELSDTTGNFRQPIPVDVPTTPLRDYKVIYAVGRLPK